MNNQVNRYRSRIRSAQSMIEVAMLVYGAALAGIYPALQLDIAEAKVRLSK